MSLGIYAYFDKQNEEIVYIGKDSHIDKDKRHKSHMQPSRYDRQAINRILQNNPDKYIYKVLYECPPHLDEIDLNGLEMQYIEALNPKFNFTIGGEGTSGFKQCDETKRKRSQALKGRVPWNKDKKCSEETKRKISESLTKPYARVVKKGFLRNGKQSYALKYKDQLIKCSIDKEKLEKMADEINQEN